MNLFQKKPKLIFAILIILITFVLLGWWFYDSLQPRFFSDQLLTKEESSQGNVLYIINKGTDNVKKYQIEVSFDSTVFSLLEKLADEANFEIETTFYPEIGIFVESIAGFKGGDDNKWWQYWVNDKLGEVAADKKKVKGGDIIEWRFELPPEF